MTDARPDATRGRGGPTVRLCLAGDVMCGRGIDQIQRHPGDPRLHERWVASADTYVRLAEAGSGPIPRHVDPGFVWGDALGVLHELAPDAFIVNLETAVTDRGSPWPDKAIHYRMNPANAAVLSVAGVDVFSLANNHVLDWSRPGLEQTLEVLRESGLRSAGAGRDSAEAWAPAVVASPRARIAVLAVGSPTGGVLPAWNAADDAPGVAVIPDLSDRSVARVTDALRGGTEPDDIIVLSIHWGPNWGHEIPAERRRFARALIDAAGVDVIHGHSSHHPLGVEVHRGRLIVHGCGDLLTDYEGISGHEEYRADLGGLWLVHVDAASGRLRRLELVPTRVQGFRLTIPGPADVQWLAQSLDKQCRSLGTRMNPEPSGHLVLEW